MEVQGRIFECDRRTVIYHTNDYFDDAFERDETYSLRGWLAVDKIPGAYTSHTHRLAVENQTRQSSIGKTTFSLL